MRREFGWDLEGTAWVGWVPRGVVRHGSFDRFRTGFRALRAGSPRTGRARVGSCLEDGRVGEPLLREMGSAGMAGGEGEG